MAAINSAPPPFGVCCSQERPHHRPHPHTRRTAPACYRGGADCRRGQTPGPLERGSPTGNAPTPAFVLVDAARPEGPRCHGASHDGRAPLLRCCRGPVTLVPQGWGPPLRAQERCGGTDWSARPAAHCNSAEGGPLSLVPGPPPRVTFRRVVAPLRGPGQSPVLPFACCVGSLRSVGRCGRCSRWCRFRGRGAQ